MSVSNRKRYTLGAWLAPLVCLPALADWTPEQWAGLLAGQAVVEYTRTEESGGAARVSIIMQTSAERLWDVLLSCQRSYEYVDGILACEVLEAGLQQERIRQSVKKAWFLPTLEYVIEFDRQPWSAIEFRRVEGDLKRLEGGWRFQDLADGGGLLVSHEIRVQPNFPVPRWLVRRTLANDLPDMLRCLRFLAAGSVDPGQAAADREACPATPPERPGDQSR